MQNDIGRKEHCQKQNERIFIWAQELELRTSNYSKIIVNSKETKGGCIFIRFQGAPGEGFFEQRVTREQVCGCGGFSLVARGGQCIVEWAVKSLCKKGPPLSR